MQHEEIESLLGAYALDAVEPDEARQIEAHLATCPRCRAELAAHQEVAAVLGNGGSEAPNGLWERIAGQLGGAPELTAPTALGAQLSHRRRRLRVTMPLLAAAVIVAIVALSLQVVNLDHQVRDLQVPSAAEALAPAVSATLSAPHTTITLTSAKTKHAGTVIVGANGTAFWIASDLPALAGSSTYQLWGLVDGRAVSLGLLGSNAQHYSAFRIERGTTRVMVTKEPEGGTSGPTTEIVVIGAVPHLT